MNHPSYLGVFLTFARNSLIRDMTFRTNFIIEMISSMSWMIMNLGFYTLVYQFTPSIAAWDKFEFFVFISTTMFVNSLVQAFFMPNMQELSELVRTGGMDFALLKPIDTQFLISLRRVNWSSLGNFFVALLLLFFCLPRIDGLQLSPWQFVLYPLYVVLGVFILYSVMITLAATSIWLGRNQSLYDFWFYITNFSRYPMEIYKGAWGTPLRNVFTFVIPILVVINVPARLMAKPLSGDQWPMALFAVLATVLSLVGSRWVFQQALRSYRSASS
ncbi:MAG: ABC-2 family transporter protein [Pirellulales bacterium]|nr:ABC-2 family transporter protein [Pirellulales bacterium]